MTPILKSRALQESDFMRPGRTSGKGREPPSEPVPSVKFSPLDAPSEFTPAAVDRRHAPLLREFGIDIVEPLTRMALGEMGEQRIRNRLALPARNVKRPAEIH